jgi:predicted nucleic acid-binding protein
MIPYSQTAEFAFQLATEFSVTLYDATYLATAIDCDAILYTADKRLHNGILKTPFGDYVEKLTY